MTSIPRHTIDSDRSGETQKGSAPGPDRYDPESVRRLFNDMPSTYGRVNLISSFGFTVRWRHQRVIPLVGRVLLGDPDCYKMLGIYTEAFGDARHFAGCLRRAGLQATETSYFFGCATGVRGIKPVAVETSSSGQDS